MYKKDEDSNTVTRRKFLSGATLGSIAALSTISGCGVGSDNTTRSATSTSSTDLPEFKLKIQAGFPAKDPLFEVAEQVYEFIKDCDLAGFNAIKFDIPILVEELIRADIDFDFSKVRMIDSQVIFHKKEPRNLSAALKFYCGKNLENAHSALDDTIATYEVFKAQLEKYDDLEPNIDFLSDYTKRSNNLDFAGKIRIDADNDAIFAFGKYTGQKVIDVFKSDKGYYSWIMKGDFPEYTKKIFTKIKLSLINDK